MKATKLQSSGPSEPRPDPMDEDPQYGHSEWVDSGIKQAVAQEERRASRHSGKTIKRPAKVMRTMSG